MASTGNWNVVGKNKKTKGQGSNLTKLQKKQFIDNMPRIEKLDPVKEDSTIYDAFVAKEQQKYERRQQEKFADKIESGKEPNGKGISDGNPKKKSSTHKNKKAEPERRRKPFEDALKDITEEDLKSVLLQSREHFPDKPELWLKDLVTFMNLKLENSPETDKHLKPENKDFPLSSMKKSCTKVFTSVLRDCTVATLEHVLYFCVNTMLEEGQNGNSTYGYKIFLQILARNRSDVVISKLSQYKDIVKSTQNRPEKCLSVLWALGQVGVTSLRSGLRVWLDIMLPCLGLRSIGGFCVQYLENILSLHGKQIDSASGEITLREYFHLLDLIFGTSLPNDLRKRLLALYPQLKNIAYGQNLSSSLRNFFPSYLTRALSECHASLKTEVLSCLIDCLSKDKHTYSLWCQLYLKHLTQSRILMEYLQEKWDSVSGRVDQKLLQQTIMTFLRTNDESSLGRNTGEWGVMTNVCEELQKKMTRPRFPWRLVMFFLISTVIAIVAYDVYTSKTLKNSRTVGFLEAYGVLGFLQEIWSRVCLYSGLVFGWLQVNVPMYCELVYNTVAPYVVKFVDFCAHIEEYTREHRKNVVDKVYAIAPEFWNEVARYLSLCWDFILEYTYWILGHIAALYKIVYQWVDTNIINGDFSSENIQGTLTWSANKVHHITLSAVEWCRQALK